MVERRSALKRSHSQITPSQISVQFDVRGSSIRKTGHATLHPLTDEHIDTNSIFTILSNTVPSDVLCNYQVLYYNCSLHGWESLLRNAMLSVDVLKYNNAVPILDVLLEDQRQLPDCAMTTTPSPSSSPFPSPSPSPSSFAIGMWHSKTAYNLVSLRRSATQLGANFVFSISDRMRNKAPLNQVIVGKTIPVKEYKTLLDFSMDTVKDDYEWVCIEMGGTPLDEFVHPPRALYILGSEDNGVSSMLRSACKHVIELPAVRSESFNVAVAGTMVMYDRYVKSIGK